MKKAVFAVALAGAALVACNPTPYEVKREIMIDAPAEVVFGYLNNHQNSQAWSPWEAMDPNMTKTYEGPVEGVGAIYRWTGNDSVGTGSLEIVESVPNERVSGKLIFTEPWESESITTYTIQETPAGTRVEWSVTGELPGMMFWMGQEDMDEAMAGDFERGLAQLKQVAEAQAAENAKNAYTAEIREVKAQPFFFIRDTVSWANMNSLFYGQRYAIIQDYLAVDINRITEPPLAVYHVWDTENQKAEVSVGFISDSKKKGNDRVKRGETHGGTAMMAMHAGTYDNSEMAHDFIAREAEAQGYNIIGSPWESYVVGPPMEPDTLKWVTEIYYPVAKVDSL